MLEPKKRSLEGEETQAENWEKPEVNMSTSEAHLGVLGKGSLG